MSDVFISYAREDAAFAQRLANLLARHGYTVFWDRNIEPGTSWDETLEREVREARSAIVIWSKHSVGSAWVKAEAEDAAKRSVLVPVLIEEVEPPLRFRAIQVANLIRWDQTEESVDAQGILKAINKLVNGSKKDPAATPITAPPRAHNALRRWPRSVAWFAIGLVAFLVLSTGGYQLRQEGVRKGWWMPKLEYFTLLQSSDGLSVGDPITLRGNRAGEITAIKLMAPAQFAYHVYVAFSLFKPYYDFVWTTSLARARWTPSRSKRYLEVLRSEGGLPSYIFNELVDLPFPEAAQLLQSNEAASAETVFDGTNVLLNAYGLATTEALQRASNIGIAHLRVIYINRICKQPTGVWDPKNEKYVTLAESRHGYFLAADEEP